MLPTINGKPIIECTEQDLLGIINDSNYRENEYLDYKSDFSVLKYNRGDKKRDEALVEFRNDVCSFANAEGGYLIYGICADKGIPSAVSGLEINNDDTDKLELNIKNYLQPIQPRMPNCSFHFVHLENGRFVMVILVRHDAFAPYIHIENEKDYRIYKRSGNSKSTIAYSELRNMFVQSVALEKEIEQYRESRIDSFRKQGNQRFILVHIIPDTFLDSSYNKLVYVIDRQNQNELSTIFQNCSFGYLPSPMVDGLRHVSYDDYYQREGRIFNNCVLEFYDSLQHEVETHTTYGEEYEFFAYEYVWDLVAPLIYNYFATMKKHLATKRVFVCISIIGCKDVYTKKDHPIYISTIDRDTLMLEPAVFESFEESSIDQCMNRLKLHYLLSLGIRKNKNLEILLDGIRQ